MARGPDIRFERFEYDRRGEAIIRRSAPIRAGLLELSQRGAEAARGFAPIDQGDYAASIEGTVVMAADGLRGRIRSDDFKAHWMEWGTVDTPAFHPLQRGAMTLPGRFEGTGR